MARASFKTFRQSSVPPFFKMLSNHAPTPCCRRNYTIAAADASASDRYTNRNANVQRNTKCYSDGHPRCDANNDSHAKRNCNTDAHYTETHSYPPAAFYAIAPPDSGVAVKRRNPLPCSKTNAEDSAPRRKTSVKAAVPAAKRRRSQATRLPLQLRGVISRRPGSNRNIFGGQESLRRYR